MPASERRARRATSAASPAGASAPASASAFATANCSLPPSAPCSRNSAAASRVAAGRLRHRPAGRRHAGERDGVARGASRPATSTTGIAKSATAIASPRVAAPRAAPGGATGDGTPAADGARSQACASAGPRRSRSQRVERRVDRLILSRLLAAVGAGARSRGPPRRRVHRAAAAAGASAAGRPPATDHGNFARAAHASDPRVTCGRRAWPSSCTTRVRLDGLHQVASKPASRARCRSLLLAPAGDRDQHASRAVAGVGAQAPRELVAVAASAGRCRGSATSGRNSSRRPRAPRRRRARRARRCRSAAQDQREAVREVLVVVDDAGCGGRRPSRAPARGVARRLTARARASGRRTMNCAAAGPGPRCAPRCVPAVQLDQAAREREADAEARLRALERAVGLREHVEDAAASSRRDADAVVAHAHHDVARRRAPRASSMRPPGSVYLAALLSRLENTCARRVASPSSSIGLARQRRRRACGGARR